MAFQRVGPGGITLFSDAYPNLTPGGSFAFTSAGGVYAYECNGNGSRSIAVTGIASGPIR